MDREYWREKSRYSPLGPMTARTSPLLTTPLTLCIICVPLISTFTSLNRNSTGGVTPKWSPTEVLASIFSWGELSGLDMVTMGGWFSLSLVLQLHIGQVFKDLFTNPTVITDVFPHLDDIPWFANTSANTWAWFCLTTILSELQMAKNRRSQQLKIMDGIKTFSWKIARS